MHLINLILSYFHLSYNWCLLRQLSRSRPSYTKANGFYLAHCNRGQSTCCFRFSSKRIPLSSNNSVFQSFDLVLSHHHKSSHLLDHLTTHRPSFALKISPIPFPSHNDTSAAIDPLPSTHQRSSPTRLQVRPKWVLFHLQTLPDMRILITVQAVHYGTALDSRDPVDKPGWAEDGHGTDMGGPWPHLIWV